MGAWYCRRVLEHLVVLALAGESQRLVALKRYFVENASPSEVADEVGRGKLSVRGWFQRVSEIGGSSVAAALVVRACVDSVVRLEPLLLLVGRERYVCRVCGREVTKPLNHILNRHRDLVELHLRKVSHCLNGRRNTH